MNRAISKPCSDKSTPGHKFCISFPWDWSSLTSTFVSAFFQIRILSNVETLPSVRGKVAIFSSSGVITKCNVKSKNIKFQRKKIIKCLHILFVHIYALNHDRDFKHSLCKNSKLPKFCFTNDSCDSSLWST